MPEFDVRQLAKEVDKEMIWLENVDEDIEDEFEDMDESDEELSDEEFEDDMDIDLGEECSDITEEEEIDMEKS